MKTRFITTAFVCMVCMVMSVNAEEMQTAPAAYDLPGLYRFALERAETIKISEADLGIAQNYKKAAFSALVPKLSAFNSYTHYTETNTVQPDWSNTWGGLLTYTFTLNGRELLAFGIAADNIEGREHQLRAAKESYLLMVAATYYDALKAAEMEKAAEENLERLEQHKAAVEARLRLGVVTRPDVYRVEAELSSAQADLTDARNVRFLAESSLGRAVGLEGNFALVPPDTMGITPLAAERLEQLQHKALQQRADLKAGKVAEKMARSQIKLEKSAYWPTVSLEGGYTSTEADPEVFSPEDESICGSVTVNVPIFDGGLRRANTGTARAELEKARLEREALEKDIRVEVEQAWRELFSKLERRNALADKLAFAGENFNAVSKQFDNGLATSIDRIDANTLFTQAAKELAAAEYACAVAALRLEKVTGVFLETVMGVLDNT